MQQFVSPCHPDPYQSDWIFNPRRITLDSGPPPELCRSIVIHQLELPFARGSHIAGIQSIGHIEIVQDKTLVSIVIRYLKTMYWNLFFYLVDIISSKHILNFIQMSSGRSTQKIPSPSHGSPTAARVDCSPSGRRPFVILRRCASRCASCHPRPRCH